MTRIGIVGAGTMGSGIAIACAAHGCEVTLVDAAPEMAAKAKGAAETFWGRAVEKGRMSAADATAAAERLRAGTTLSDLSDRQLVIEAVFEDFELKARVFGELGDVLARDCLVATNTSCLKVSDLQTHITSPERFLGLHYFSPAQINPIVEVVRGARTARETFDAALAFCRATGKHPLPCLDQYGFAINRFFCPYTNEAVRALDDGLGTPAEIDRVAEGAVGAAAGPFAVMNLIKPRINLHAIRHLTPLGDFYAPAASMIRVGEAGEDWPIGSADAVDAERGAVIADRLRCGIFLPVLQELDENIAEPAIIDQGAREALRLGHPPCALMDRLGRDEVERVIRPALDRFRIEAPAALERVGQLVG